MISPQPVLPLLQANILLLLVHPLLGSIPLPQVHLPPASTRHPLVLLPPGNIQATHLIPVTLPRPLGTLNIPATPLPLHHTAPTPATHPLQAKRLTTLRMGTPRRTGTLSPLGLLVFLQTPRLLVLLQLRVLLTSNNNNRRRTNQRVRYLASHPLGTLLILGSPLMERQPVIHLPLGRLLCLMDSPLRLGTLRL